MVEFTCDGDFHWNDTVDLNLRRRRNIPNGSYRWRRRVMRLPEQRPVFCRNHLFLGSEVAGQ
jgi:hypothetical protein